jgi:hypothetical protein
LTCGVIRSFNFSIDGASRFQSDTLPGQFVTWAPPNNHFISSLLLNQFSVQWLLLNILFGAISVWNPSLWILHISWW